MIIRSLLAIFLLLVPLTSWADLGPGWVEVSSSNGVTSYVPSGDNPTGSMVSAPLIVKDGKSYYSTGAAVDQTAVGADGRIARTMLEVKRVERMDGSIAVYSTPVTMYTESVESANAAWGIVKADTAGYPAINQALTSVATSGPKINDVVSINGSNYKVTTAPVGTNYNTKPCSWPQFSPYIFGAMFWSEHQGECFTDVYGNSMVSNIEYASSVSPTSLPSTWPPPDPSTVDNPQVLPNTAPEVDKLIVEHPELFTPSYTSSAALAFDGPPVGSPMTSALVDRLYTPQDHPSTSGSGMTPSTPTPTPPAPGGAGNPEGDSIALQNIANNIGAMNNNIIRSADYLHNIYNTLTDLKNAMTSGNGNRSADVKDGLVDYDASLSGSASAASGTIQGTPSEYDSTFDNFSNEVEQGAFEALFNTAKSSGALSTIKQSVGISVSGSSSHLDTSIYGKSVSLDFSRYEWFFVLIGQMFLGLCFLYSFFLTMRA